MPIARFKVVLLGEGRVGKTSILLRYVKGERVPASDDPPNISSTRRSASQERFHALGPIYYRDADGALLVYDITDFESFQKVRKWVRELRQIVGQEIAITIAGNKVDLESSRAVPEAEALDYAASVGATHVYTSAKLNKGLEDAFAELSERMATRRNETRGPGAAGLPGAKRSSISIVDDPVAPKKKDSCC
ncbi:GTPase [Aureococcus anophagefferens]|nr:GTPase [Aureococcus anophagefferens]